VNAQGLNGYRFKDVWAIDVPIFLFLARRGKLSRCACLLLLLLLYF